MTLLLKQIFAFLKLLNSDSGTNSLAAGLALGLVLGFSPLLSLQSLLIICICFFFRVQLGAAFISGFFFKFVAYLIDPVSDLLGRTVLESESLRPLFVELYNLPLIPLTRFNNSIVMGSGLTALILAVPLFFVFKRLILKYRKYVVERVRGTKWWKAMQATAFFKWYASYDRLFGN